MKNIVIALAAFVLVLNGQAQSTPDISSEFDTIQAFIQQRDLLGASRHTRNITNFAVARLAALPPNSSIVAPITYQPNGGDLTLLLTMVEQNRAAFQTGDFFRLLQYSISLSNALQKESVSEQPTSDDSLEQAEQSVAGVSAHQRFLSLPKLAKVAFAANDLVKSSSYANEALTTAAANPNWPQGEAIHVGNIILGRVALANGDVAVAGSYLVAAGKTMGSPSLNSFGPNMALANDLLAKGQREVVLQYLAECATFWKTDRGALARWTTAIQSNKVPDFGANLRY